MCVNWIILRAAYSFHHKYFLSPLLISKHFARACKIDRIDLSCVPRELILAHAVAAEWVLALFFFHIHICMYTGGMSFRRSDSANITKTAPFLVDEIALRLIECIHTQALISESILFHRRNIFSSAIFSPLVPRRKKLNETNKILHICALSGKKSLTTT